jgi:Protein of unknown function (DUF1761)
MPELNWLAVIVAAAAVFVMSTVYYIVFAARMVDLRGGSQDESGGMAPWKIGVELVRNLVLATVVAGLVALLDVNDVAGALQLALVLWVAFPLILLTGSVIWENVSPMLAIIHAGDWLLKLVIIATIVTLWS